MRIIQTILVFTVIASAISDCPDDPFCRACNDDARGNWCDWCYHSFWNHQEKKCDRNVPKKVDNCSEYIEYGTDIHCEICELGYHMTDDKTCEKCKTENCSICPVGGDDCVACFNGLMPVFNEKEQRTVCSDKKKCDIKNCSMCALDKSRVSCYLCNDGFAVSWKTFECVPSVPGCLIIGISPNECSACRSGYYTTKDGQCKPSPADNPLSSFILAFKHLKATHRPSERLSAMPL